MLPTGGLDPRDDTPWAYRDMAAVGRRISRAYTASRRYLADPPGALMPLPPRWLRRLLLAPPWCCSRSSLVDHAAGLGAARRWPRPRWSRAGCGRCGCSGSAASTWSGTPPRCSRCSCSGSPPASAGGSRSPAFQRAHYVLAGWFLRVLFWQARWTLRLQHRRRRHRPGHRAARPARAGALPARRAGRLVHPDPRAGQLVRPGAADRAQGHACSGTRRSTCCSTGCPTGSSRRRRSAARRR